MSAESAFRNTIGDTRSQAQSFFNMSVQLTQPRCIRSNTKNFVVPYSRPGTFAVFDLARPGKQPDVPPLVLAHEQAITGLDISPHLETLVVTGSRTPVIKLWDVKENLIQAATASPPPTRTASSKQPPPSNEPIQVLQGHEKRITGLYFNPYVKDLLLSNAVDTAKLWDINTGKETHSLIGPGMNDPAFCEWSSHGTLLSAAKDGLAIFDPRAGKTNVAIVEQPHPNKPKGFQACFLGEAGEKMCSVGWNADKRELALWDIRNPSSAIKQLQLDRATAFLLPFFEEATGLLFLVEKGTQTFYYEILSAEPYAYKCDVYSSKINQGSACMLPKRVCDVMKCEVARFLYCSKDQVNTTYFTVPRKFRDVFQEDIFPPIHDGAGQPLKSWLKKEQPNLNYISLKPAGVKSVYEVGKAEGGRSRKLDEMKKSGKTKDEIRLEVKADQKGQQLTQGTLEMSIPGYFWEVWLPYSVEIKKKNMYLFQTQDSAIPNDTIEFSAIESVLSDPEDSRILVITKIDKSEVILRATTEQEQASWIKAILRAKEASELPDTAQKSTNSGVSVVDMEEEAAVQQESGAGTDLSFLPKPEGYLSVLTFEYFFSSWIRKFWRVDDDLVLNGYASESSDIPTERIDLSRVIAAHPTENTEECAFQIATAQKSWTLRCETKEEVQDWIQALEEIRRYMKSKNSDGEIVDAGTTVVQHHVVLKLNHFGIPKRLWVVAAGNDILCYPFQGESKTVHCFPCNEISIFDAPSEKTHDKDFNLKLKDINNTRCFFTCETNEHRDEYAAWYKEVSVAQNALVDISRELGIDAESIDSFTTKVLEARMLGTLDLNEVKRGNQPVFVKILGRLRTRGQIVNSSYEHMQSGGCYVLDLGTVIYEWYGSKSNRFQRNKALDIVSRIRMKERGGTAKIIRLVEAKDDDDDKFWKAIGGKHPMPEAVINGKDEDKIYVTRNLYRVYKDKINRLFNGTTLPSCKLLQSNAVFVVEAEYEFWTWTGRTATPDDRKLAYLLVEKLQARIKDWTCWARVAEGGETVLFKENFADFPGQLMITSKPEGSGGGNVSAKKEQQPVDIRKMLLGEPRPLEHSVLYDDGSGILKIWKIEGFDKVDFPKKYKSHLWSADSYLMLYEYKVNSSDKALLYFWQGRDCSINEKGTSAYLTKEASDLLRGKMESKQIRTTQGNERTHFFTVFMNVLVIHTGKFEDGWEARLFEVWQSTDSHVRAIEVECNASRLHSHRTFVLYTPNKIFAWCGRARTEQEQEIAFEVAKNMQILAPKAQIITAPETKETSDFWELLGGKQEYFSEAVDFRPHMKLFEFSNSTGAVDVEEQHDFNQDSLDHNKVMVVDTGFCIWVWFGSKCKVIEEKWALDAAIRYASENSKLPKDAPIHQTRAWQEPTEFTSLFQAWNTNKWPRNLPKNQPPIQRNAREVFKEYTKTVFTIAELTAKTLPKGIDPTNKEKYLSDDDFASLFGMTKEEYEKKPAWKRETIKKQAGLY